MILPKFQRLFLSLSACLFLFSCNPILFETEVPTQKKSLSTPTTFQDNSLSSSFTPKTPTVTNPQTLIYKPNPDLPPGFARQLSDLGLLDDVNSADQPAYTFSFNNDHPIGRWIYALAAPFPTITDEISQAQLKFYWQDEADETAEEIIPSLLVAPEDLAGLTSLLGKPSSNVRVEQSDKILESSWTNQNTWAIIPFEKIEPRWKIISIEGQSPIQKTFDSGSYPLSLPISFELLSSSESWVLPQELRHKVLSNLDSSKITTVILTGVTALVRATAVGMDKRGILVPGEYLAPILREADLLHISNEVPFAEGCPPHTAGSYLVFCSPESYLGLLREIGTDIVELTGDHFQDYGREGMLFTLDLYAKEGWYVYGGGKDIFDARKPVRLLLNGNKIAFLGCNAKSPNFAQASETSTGAYHCDMEYIAQTVRELKEEGYLPIVTFQHEERYEWSPNAQMLRDFNISAEAGAVIVSGSQSHVPHFAEFYHDSFLHYGLGNLFFDQYGIAENTDIGFLDRHVFYEGKYLGVELFPIQFLDKVQARLMTPEERAATFKVMFNTMRMWWKDETNQPVRPPWVQSFPWD